MSKRPNAALAQRKRHAQVFAALGDETRLALLAQLGSGSPLSITQLATGAPITRQAITKHLHQLERASLIRCTRAGRESTFQLDPAPLMELGQYLSLVGQQWDRALTRLKTFAESN